jgi:hypothetical protein
MKKNASNDGDLREGWMSPLERYCLPVHCWAYLALKILGLRIKLSCPKLRLPFRLQKRYFGGIIPARPP